MRKGGRYLFSGDTGFEHEGLDNWNGVEGDITIM